MEEKCVTCGEETPKYRCPHCVARYCSIKCFKPHIDTHSIDKPTEKPSSPPHTPTQLPLENLSSLPTSILNSANLPVLQRKYPNLLPQLKRVYEATLHPGELPGNEDEKSESMGQKSKGKRPEPWTQERADERALGLLIELQLQDESVAEFLELVRMLDEKLESEQVPVV